MEYRNFRCKWINKKELWERAEEIRIKYWSENKLPVNMEEIIEFSLKLDIIPIHNLLPLLDMDAYLKLDLSGIVVDYDCYMNEKYANRLRFSLAHEMGHYFLHRDIYSGLPFGPPEELEKFIENWKDFVINAPENEYSNFEWQANEFAGRFLVPYDALRIEVGKVLEIIRQSNLIEFLMQDPDAVLSRVTPILRKTFGVSEQVIKIRVDSENLWPPDF